MPGPVFFFFALVGLVTVGTAGYFAFRPSERTLGIIRPLCSATTFASLAAFFAGMTNGLFGLGHGMANSGGQLPGGWTAVISAFAETPIPLVAGFALVSVSWLLVAVGLRRQL